MFNSAKYPRVFIFTLLFSILISLFSGMMVFANDITINPDGTIELPDVDMEDVNNYLNDKTNSTINFIKGIVLKFTVILFFIGLITMIFGMLTSKSALKGLVVLVFAVVLFVLTYNAEYILAFGVELFKPSK